MTTPTAESLKGAETTPQAMAMALEHHRAGRLAEAEQIYRKVLAIQPDNSDALHHLGLIALQTNKYQPAAVFIEQALQHNPANPALWIDLGATYRGLGRSGDAETCYRKALALSPDRPEAHNNLGNILRDTGRQQDAVQSFRRALALNPRYVEAHNNLGNALIDLQDLTGAEACFQRSLALDPQRPDTHSFLAIALQALAKPQEAVRHLRQAVALKPSYADAHYTLGLALRRLGQLAEAEHSLRQAVALSPESAHFYNGLAVVMKETGRLEEAERCCRKALSLKADFPQALSNLGGALTDLGRTSEAEQCFRSALKINPDFAEAHNNLGVTLRDLGRLKEAEAHLQRAIILSPTFAEAHNNLGNICLDLGNFAEAERSYREAIRRNPDYVEAHNNLANALKGLYRMEEAEVSLRRAISFRPEYAIAHSNLGNVLKDLGRLEDAEASYRKALAVKPGFSEAHSNLIFLLDLLEGRDISEQQDERRRWYLQHAQKFAPSSPRYDNAVDPDRKLRIGYVSADFYRHSAYCAFGPVICSHDRSAFEVYCYSGVRREDEATLRLKAIASEWRATIGIADDALAEQIRRDRIDILVDLSGHSAGNRLLTFARKPAPIQVTAWGHVSGTGFPTMDYIFADPVYLPKKNRGLFSEKVVDLPCFIHYEPHGQTPDVQPLPALTEARFMFGCVSRTEKISDKSLGLWGRILDAVPDAGLLIKGRSLDDMQHREHLLRRAAGRGIPPDRIEFAGSSSYFEHLKAYHRIDVGLDTFPHGGGIGTAEALWMGVPVITLPGQTVPSRASASILAAVGMKDWIARSESDYIRLAVDASRELPRLAHLRQGLRAQVGGSVFADAKRYTIAVERAYRTMWKHWCKRS